MVVIGYNNIIIKTYNTSNNDNNNNIIVYLPTPFSTTKTIISYTYTVHINIPNRPPSSTTVTHFSLFIYLFFLFFGFVFYHQRRGPNKSSGFSFPFWKPLASERRRRYLSILYTHRIPCKRLMAAQLSWRYVYIIHKYIIHSGGNGLYIIS